jgi:hypothetical protein
VPKRKEKEKEKNISVACTELLPHPFAPLFILSLYFDV